MKFKCGDICVIKEVTGNIPREHAQTISLNAGKIVIVLVTEEPDDSGEYTTLTYLVKSLDGSDFEYYSGVRYDDLWLPEEALEISNKYTLYDDVDCDGGILV